MVEQPQLSKEEIEKRIQMMKENCIFCKIIKGEIPGKTIFEDEICIAILDINPATNGHVLLMPKEHYMMMPMVPDEVLGHLSVISNYISDLLKDSLDAKECTQYIANGAAAGQQVQHFMMHVIPRYDNDGLNFDVSGDPIPQNELEELAQKLKVKLNEFSKQGQ